MASPSSEDVYRYKYRGWVFPTFGFALAIHERALNEGGGLPGFKDRGLVLSALNCPVESAGGEDAYYTLFDKVAALGWRVGSNHGFSDGNKRTSLLLTEATLNWNGYYLINSWTPATRELVFSLIGAGHMKREGLKHALLLGCGLDPLRSDP